MRWRYATRQGRENEMETGRERERVNEMEVGRDRKGVRK